jgi:hypothetical protein
MIYDDTKTCKRGGQAWRRTYGNMANRKYDSTEMRQYDGITGGR